MEELISLERNARKRVEEGFFVDFRETSRRTMNTDM